jgi:hypothetical protein
MAILQMQMSRSDIHLKVVEQVYRFGAKEIGGAAYNAE